MGRSIFLSHFSNHISFTKNLTTYHSFNSGISLSWKLYTFDLFIYPHQNTFFLILRNKFSNLANVILHTPLTRNFLPTNWLLREALEFSTRIAPTSLDNRNLLLDYNITSSPFFKGKGAQS